MFSLLLQESTPDTTGYMIAGYVIAFLFMGLYVASMYLRTRNLKQDMSMLQEMEKPAPAAQRQTAPKPASPKATKTVTKQRAKK